MKRLLRSNDIDRTTRAYQSSADWCNPLLCRRSADPSRPVVRLSAVVRDGEHERICGTDLLDEGVREPAVRQRPDAERAFLAHLRIHIEQGEQALDLLEDIFAYAVRGRLEMAAASVSSASAIGWYADVIPLGGGGRWPGRWRPGRAPDALAPPRGVA